MIAQMSRGGAGVVGDVLTRCSSEMNCSTSSMVCRCFLVVTKVNPIVGTRRRAIAVKAYSLAAKLATRSAASADC
jgi:hypothetical protein